MKTMLWAFDPFTEPSLRSKLANALREWGGQEEIEIQPVYVLHPSLFNVSRDFFRESFAQLRASVLSRIEGELANCDMRGLRDPVLLDTDSLSRRVAAHLLADYAESRKVELIAVASRSKTGIAHAALRTFADALIGCSRVPVLTVTPYSRPFSRQGKILFPTDLGSSSRQALEKRVIPLARARRNRLILMHVTNFLAEHPEATFGPPDAYFDYAEKEEGRQRRVLEEMVSTVHRAGVDAEGILKANESAPAEVILAEAEKREVSLIALASQREGIEGFLLGSTAHEVLRRAPAATLIWHEGA